MEFNNSTSEIGIISEIDRICGTNDTSYTLKAKTARVNIALDRFAFLALSADSIWTFDDFQKADLPIGTSNIVSAQQDYEFADEVLVVEKVYVADSAGDFSEIEPIVIRDEDAEEMFTLPTGNTGTPSQYLKIGHSLLLSPIPNYAYTNGLKVVFKRNVVKFASTDTTTEVGIPDIFHPYIARAASLPYLIEKGLKYANAIKVGIVEDEKAILEYFSILRGKDIKPNLSMKMEDTR